MADERRAIMPEEAAKPIDPQVLDYYRETVAPKVLLSLVRGLMEGVFELDEESRNKVLSRMGWHCFNGFKEFLPPMSTGLDLDSAFEWLNGSVPHQRRFEKAGDTIVWDGEMADVYGSCMCVLVRLGIIEPRPELCVCSAHHCKTALEEITGLQTEAELVESVNSGCRDCVYRFHLKPTAYSSKSGT
jgi:hypothetical protein